MGENKQNLEQLHMMLKELEFAMSEKAIITADQDAQSVFRQGMITAADIKGFLSNRIKELNRSFYS